jgi:GNAT superfamily N-acetyltransferase
MLRFAEPPDMKKMFWGQSNIVALGVSGALPREIVRMGYSFLPLQDSDLRATYEIRFSVTENLIHEAQVKYLQRGQALQDIRQGGGWVCRDGQREVGFCLPLLIPEPYLAAIFVIPEYQCKGIGKHLMKLALSWFEKQGAHKAYLETDRGSKAERFYRHLGWHQEGEAELDCQVRYALDLR